MAHGDEVVSLDDETDPPVAGAGTGAVAEGADAGATAGPSLDLDAVERDLADVETALERLDAGTYWTDEVSGHAIPDHQLAADPLRRRAH